MAERVFQVGYDQGLLRVRALALTQHGFSVVSALGNVEARRVLASDSSFDPFLIGWCTTYEQRRAIVGWLKQCWPKIPVIAIHDTFQSSVPEADYAATHDTPEDWILAVHAPFYNPFSRITPKSERFILSTLLSSRFQYRPDHSRGLHNAVQRG